MAALSLAHLKEFQDERETVERRRRRKVEKKNSLKILVGKRESQVISCRVRAIVKA